MSLRQGVLRQRLKTLALVAPVLLLGSYLAGAQTVLDDFEDLSGWSTIASQDTSVWVVQEPGRTGKAMRIGFDLNAAGGYIIVRKTFSVPLPENYAFTFYLRGEAPQNHFEFKLVDPSGKNVWWRKQRDFNFPKEWQKVTIRKSRLEFAWGPSGGRELQRVGAIEFAISSSTGGKGSVWIDDLEFEERERPSHDGWTPSASASSSISGHEPALMVDRDAATSWRSASQPDSQWVILDLLENLEYGGLVIDWDPNDYATAYQVQVSNDGTRWTSAYATASGNGGRDYVYMPDAESRYVKLDLQRSSRGQGYGIASVLVKPVDFSASPNQFFASIARDGPVGRYPKYFYGRQTYWTVIGANGDGKEGLLNEEGMLEVDKNAFSIEPFLFVDGKLITWNSVRAVQELDQGYLPLPSVTWEHDSARLTVSAFAGGKPGASALYATYRVENTGDTARRIELFLALRPFQVNPPWQSLNMSGGVAPIREIRFDGRAVWVDRDKAVISLPPPDHFGAVTFDQGPLTDFLEKGRIPPHSEVSDPFGFASGALQYSFDLKPGAREQVDLAVPFHEPYVAAAIGLGPESGRSFINKQRDETRRYWQTVLGRVEIQLPPEAEKITKALKTTLAYILINRDGAALQPGSRDYARAWIRDGVLTSTALLQMGCTQEVQDFIRWFAQYQTPSGKIPCCVDRRGPDPTLEHDSAGEFIHAVAEYYRYTHDVGFVHDLWPQVVRAVDYLSALRQTRTTATYRTPGKEAFYGLLPESLSHEGYSSSPVHSYWDDFFALRGFKDAAMLAAVVGDEERATSFASLRDSFRQDLNASISKAMADHNIDYIPGSVEFGDFDPTSTAIALSIGIDPADLPEAALRRTLERYYANFDERLHGEVDWEAYTPYELRNVDAFVRLGQRERALEILNLMLFDQRPAAWNQWAEVVWRDSTAPNFIGDMPHTWVGSTFIHSVRTLLAYERESDRALIIAAGVPSGWALSASGVAVKRLPTHYGVLNYTLRKEGSNAMLLQLSGDLALPPGKIVVQPPLPQPLKAAAVNGRPVETVAPDSVTISEFPAEVLLEY